MGITAYQWLNSLYTNWLGRSQIKDAKPQAQPSNPQDLVRGTHVDRNIHSARWIVQSSNTGAESSSRSGAKSSHGGRASSLRYPGAVDEGHPVSELECDFRRAK